MTYRNQSKENEFAKELTLEESVQIAKKQLASKKAKETEKLKKEQSVNFNELLWKVEKEVIDSVKEGRDMQNIVLCKDDNLDYARELVIGLNEALETNGIVLNRVYATATAKIEFV